jgi:hypothetical protein
MVIVRTSPQTSGCCPGLNYDHCYVKSSELMEDCSNANAVGTLVDIAYTVGTVPYIAYAFCLAKIFPRGLLHIFALKNLGTPLKVKIQIVCKVGFMVFKRSVLGPRFQHSNWEHNLTSWGRDIHHSVSKSDVLARYVY